MAIRPHISPYPDIQKAFFSSTGYRYAYDIRYSVSGLAFPGIIATVAWNADRKLISGTNLTETKITSAGMFVYQEGFGWAKLNELTGYDAEVAFSDRIIRFSKRFALEVSTNPVLKAIPLLGEADGANRWAAEIHGHIDVVSKVVQAEFVWV